MKNFLTEINFAKKVEDLLFGAFIRTWAARFCTPVVLENSGQEPTQKRTRITAYKHDLDHAATLATVLFGAHQQLDFWGVAQKILGEHRLFAQPAEEKRKQVNNLLTNPTAATDALQARVVVINGGGVPEIGADAETKDTTEPVVAEGLSSMCFRIARFYYKKQKKLTSLFSFHYKKRARLFSSTTQTHADALPVR